ncbi:hypothetical protein [Bifidobacterium eulemuris]|uniref:Uncharacterized protein n=1 Tax=Bifidobacterium eulemuris TaxID=1765219 RepID=A0A261GAF7_9BIFI|nr:hypothetical protein [Bifidobacterium eulemuris]OZG68223.1 hypothetical protein BEUL_1236 [Bifidobacterium eulemuris]QOL31720.1 hypothetical protein BE0216_04010 [Bifidobacterium eulemuris]
MRLLPCPYCGQMPKLAYQKRCLPFIVGGMVWHLPSSQYFYNWTWMRRDDRLRGMRIGTYGWYLHCPCGESDWATGFQKSSRKALGLYNRWAAYHYRHDDDPDIF